MRPFSRRRRYSQLPARPWLQVLFNRFTMKYWIIGGALLIALIVGLIVYQNSRRVTPQDTAFYQKQQIVVGMAAGNAKFSYTDENGELAGFERDVADAVLSALYPDVPRVYVAIDAQQASYLLREGEIDIAFGMFTRDVIKTQGLAVSNGYFRDGVYAFVAPGGDITSLSGIQGKKVSIMTSEISKSSVTDALAEEKFEVDVYSCSAYPDGIQEVLSGNSAALIVSRYKMLPYEGQLSMAEPAITSANYCAIAWSGNRDVITVFNEQLQKMRSDGSLDALMAKWGITEYEPET